MIGAVIVVLLAMYGCAAGVRALVLRLLRPAEEDRCVWLIPLSNSACETEYRIRSAAAQCRWGGWPRCVVYAVDVGADEETRRIAQKTCDAVEGAQFVTAEEWHRIFF